MAGHHDFMNGTVSYDHVHRFTFDNRDIRGELVTLRDSYTDATQAQELAPRQRRLLGEFFAAVTLLAGTLKFRGMMTLQARGDGPIPLIMASCTHDKTIRGIVRAPGRNEAEAAIADDTPFPALIGRGVLTITIEPERGERYQGIVPLEGETLAACIEHYFEQSEQLPTRIWLAADDRHCGGLMLQALPSQGDKQAQHETWETASHLAATVTPEELLTVDHQTVLRQLFHETPVRLHAGNAVRFFCSCSRERSARALRSLGASDVQTLIAERDIITIDCQFCGRTYSFDERDVDDLFSGGGESVH